MEIMRKIIFILSFSLVIPFLGSAQENYSSRRNNYFFPDQKNVFLQSLSFQSIPSAFVISRLIDSRFYYPSVYRNFESYQFRFPQGAVFCRMEEKSVRRFNVMFSVHAGVYSEN